MLKTRRTRNFSVIERLKVADKYQQLDLLVRLRKQMRDEFDWEEYKNKLLQKSKPNQED